MGCWYAYILICIYYGLLICMGGLRPVSRHRPIRVTDVGLFPTQPIPCIGANFYFGAILSFIGAILSYIEAILSFIGAISSSYFLVHCSTPSLCIWVVRQMINDHDRWQKSKYQYRDLTKASLSPPAQPRKAPQQDSSSSPPPWLQPHLASFLKLLS